jgi:cytochrome P450
VVTTSVVSAELPGLQGRRSRRWRKAYEADPIGYLAGCRQQYGDVFMLEDDLVVITDPAMVQRLLVRTNRESVPNPNLLDGGRLPDADEVKAWIHVRELVGQVLKPTAMRPFLPGIDQAVAAGLHERRGTAAPRGVGMASGARLRAGRAGDPGRRRGDVTVFAQRSRPRRGKAGRRRP